MHELISMVEARRQGFTRYFTGKPCVHGHVAERMVCSRSCVVCLKKRATKWDIEHPEVQAKRSRKWFLANRKKSTANTLACRKRNPAPHAASAARQRAAWLQRTPVWADQEAIKMIYANAQHRREVGESVEVDHVIPLRGETVSGLHVPENLRVIPMLVNRSKANQFLET